MLLQQELLLLNYKIQKGNFFGYLPVNLSNVPLNQFTLQSLITCNDLVYFGRIYLGIMLREKCIFWILNFKAVIKTALLQLRLLKRSGVWSIAGRHQTIRFWKWRKSKRGEIEFMLDTSVNFHAYRFTAICAKCMYSRLAYLLQICKSSSRIG